MSLPYFPFYPTDFEAKTSHLSMVEDGAYNRLLRLCWMTPGCSLPDDEAWIMRRVRAFTDEERAAVVTVLSEFFEAEDGRLFSPRLRKEALLSAERHARRVEAGKQGGRAKSALKTNKKDESNAKDKPKQPEPELKVYTEANASDAKSVIWTRGVAYLQRHGSTERNARSVIGKWLKDADAEKVREAFNAAAEAATHDPIPYITAALKPKPAPQDEIWADILKERSA